MMSQAVTAFGLSVAHRVRYCSAGDCLLSGELRKCRRAQSAKDDPSLHLPGSKSYIPPSDGTATLSAGLCKGRTRALTLGADDIIF